MVELQNHLGGKGAIQVELTGYFPEFIEGKGIFSPGRDKAAEGKGINVK